MKTLLILMMLVFPEKFPDKQVDCLAHAIYHEARGESAEGQLAVAHVVLNRVQSGQFANSVCGVVYQPHQFTNIRQTKPIKSSKSWSYARLTSLYAMAGLSYDPTNGAKYFYAPAVVKPQWAKGKKKVVIGHHIFV